MKMRNAILLALLALTLATPADAKKKATWKKGYTQNDWTLGYGFNSCMMTVGSMKDIEMADVTKLTVTADNRTSIGSISASFSHRKGRRVSFGLTAAMEITNEDCMINNKSYSQDGRQIDNFVKVGELTNRYTTVTPHLRLNWKEWDKAMLYSKVAVGVTFIGDSYTNKAKEVYNVQSKKQHFFGYQVSPLGLMIGRKAGAFVEVGFGSYGIAQAGFCYKF